ncbi:TetR family transcriptional regulator [Streptomyces sp. NPDC058108]|uniref:TetR family transcriptional regulator n=1 Tax=Streptomyces sp. NPDC058108 TaxID=3346344 RepID=UPI0036E53B11
MVGAAAGLFRECGLSGISIDSIMKAADMTHGSFYVHFDSKDALAEEACARGVHDSVSAVRYDNLQSVVSAAEGHAPPPLQAVVEDYVSEGHRDDPKDRCTVAALAGDAARASEELQQVFATGITGMARAAGAARAGLVEDDGTAEPDFALLAGMVGAVILSRAVRKADLALSDRILAEARERLARDGALPAPGTRSGH